MDSADSDLFFNLGYAYWLERDLDGAIYWLRETVRRNPADDAAHYVLGVALQMSGSAAKARVSASWPGVSRRNTRSGKRHSRRRTRCRKGSSVCGPSCQRRRFVASRPRSSRPGQRNQQELAAFHVDAGRRAYLVERDDEAMASFRRAVYLVARTTPRRTCCSGACICAAGVTRKP